MPDLRERTPWGSGSPGQYREAGLPNITGHLQADIDNYYGCSGVIVGNSAYMVGFDQGARGNMGIGFNLDASLLIFQIFTKQCLAKLVHCMAWNYQAAKQKTFGSTGDCGQWNFLKAV